MKPVNHPPDAVLRAYADLPNQVFLFLRGRSHDHALDQEALFDLVDAMHNSSGIIVHYGSWTDDEKYRRLYLRPFDEKWGKKSLRLEQFLQSRLEEYLKNGAGQLSQTKMDIDTDKIDEAVLALLHLTRCDDKFGAAAWKSHDWDALNRLHEKGYIGNPVSKAKSVALTDEGKAKAEELFGKLFGKSK
jgi:hypothetical protein